MHVHNSHNIPNQEPSKLSPLALWAVEILMTDWRQPAVIYLNDGWASERQCLERGGRRSQGRGGGLVTRCDRDRPSVLLSKQTRWCGVVSAAASSEAHAVAAATKTAKTVLRKSERISVSKVTHYVTLLRFTPFFTSQAERHVRKFDKILVTLYASRRVMKSWHLGNPYLVSGH